MLYRNLNLREASVTAYEVLARSTLQRVLEVVQFANRHPDLDHEGLSREWNKKVQKSVSALSEEITAHYVRLAIDVYNRCLQRS